MDERMAYFADRLAQYNERLDYYWNRPVSDLVAIKTPPSFPGQQERHRIYSLMLMALVYHYWNGNKNGRSGKYPWNEDSSVDDGKYLDRDYIGHNIAAIAVDADGNIIDFDFNHNKLMNSSVEHAESRLVRRVYSLAQIHDSWHVSTDNGSASARTDYNTFENVTIYTSLESCAQCAGIMALGRVWRIVYLQSDPGMYLIGNIIHNLTRGTKLEAPLPIAARELGLPYFDELNSGFEYFQGTVEEKPFHISPDGREDHGKSVTSFLCTKMARDIYDRAARNFDRLSADSNSLEYPDFRPVDRNGEQLPIAKTNLESLVEAHSFFRYAITAGQRGTPHTL